MPELPEIETIKRELADSLAGEKITGFKAGESKQIRPSSRAVRKAVVGAKIAKIGRRAKLIQIFLDNNKILLIHLKMSGRLLLRKDNEAEDGWQRAKFELEGGNELRFSDPRKFGWIRLISSEKELKKLLSKFGSEALGGLNLKKFGEILSKSSQPVKVVLMDQKKIAGVGNIYANEALFLAGIDPRRKADKLKPEEAKKLVSALKKVLRAGIKYRGASEQYYLDALGRPGSYQDHFLVYGRQGKNCFRCRTKIKKIKINGRGTYYCPNCQR
jgi:formamidopyrimidine-DNA glycosylase